MKKTELLRALQTEIRRHDFSHFTDQGVTVPGCSTCKKRINTMHMFTEHLCLDVIRHCSIGSRQNNRIKKLRVFRHRVESRA